jgi:hypothetical protein
MRRPADNPDQHSSPPDQLQGFGNVLDVLPLVGAILRADITYASRALEGSDFGATVRTTIVLLSALSVVASLLTSLFGLKRLLFNQYVT